MSAEAHAVRAAGPSAPARGTPFRAYVVADARRMSRTWLFPLTLLGPVGVTLMGVVLFLLRGSFVVTPFLKGQATGWQVLINQLGMVHVFALGLGATLVASMIVDVEHRSGTWKQLFGLPVSRAAVYLVKFGWGAVLLAASSLLMSAGYAALMTWQHLGPLPWGALGAAAALPWVASLPLLAFQLLLSTNLRNQALPLTVGVLAPMFGMGMSPMPSWLPWRLMTEAMTWAAGGVIAGGPGRSLGWLTPGQIGGASLAWIAVLVGLGAFALVRRDVR
jgi:lantibiotic transport system permease protein